jgi:general secretion pathway protein L
LVVLRRADVAKLGPAVEPLGLRIARLEVAGAGFEGGVIPIPMHDRESDRSMGGERKIEIGLVAIAGVLGFLCLAVPYWRTSVAIESLTAQMADMRQQAGALASLKKQIDSKQLDAQFLSDRKRSMPTATELLAELTRLIPDDTYLTELSIAGDRLRLVGAANSATAILTLIAQNPAFHGAAFQSPIVQDQRLNRERFDIAVRAVQRDGQ